MKPLIFLSLVLTLPACADPVGIMPYDDLVIRQGIKPAVANDPYANLDAESEFQTRVSRFLTAGGNLAARFDEYSRFRHEIIKRFRAKWTTSTGKTISLCMIINRHGKVEHVNICATGGNAADAQALWIMRHLRTPDVPKTLSGSEEIPVSFRFSEFSTLADFEPNAWRRKLEGEDVSKTK